MVTSEQRLEYESDLVLRGGTGFNVPGYTLDMLICAREVFVQIRDHGVFTMVDVVSAGIG